MNWLLLIVAIIILIVFKFFYDWKRQMIKISLEGGVTKKYANLISTLKGNSSWTVKKNDSEIFSFYNVTPNAVTIFTFIEAFGNIKVIWEFKASILSIQKLDYNKSWLFASDCNQVEAGKKILKDIETELEPVLGNFTSPEIKFVNKEISEGNMPIKHNLPEFLYNYSDAIDLLYNNYDNKKFQYILLDTPTLKNESDPTGEKLIHHATSTGNIDAVQLLLDFDANVNSLGFNKETPVYRAIANKDLDMLKFLISEGALVYVGNDNGLTPIAIAENFGFNNEHELYRLLWEKSKFEQSIIERMKNISLTHEQSEKIKNATSKMLSKIEGVKSFKKLAEYFSKEMSRLDGMQHYPFLVKGWQLLENNEANYIAEYSRIYFTTKNSELADDII